MRRIDNGHAGGYIRGCGMRTRAAVSFALRRAGTLFFITRFRGKRRVLTGFIVLSLLCLVGVFSPNITDYIRNTAGSDIEIVASPNKRLVDTLLLKIESRDAAHAALDNGRDPLLRALSAYTDDPAWDLSASHGVDHADDFNHGDHGTGDSKQVPSIFVAILSRPENLNKRKALRDLSLGATLEKLTGRTWSFRVSHSFFVLADTRRPLRARQTATYKDVYSESLVRSLHAESKKHNDIVFVGESEIDAASRVLGTGLSCRPNTGATPDASSDRPPILWSRRPCELLSVFSHVLRFEKFHTLLVISDKVFLRPEIIFPQLGALALSSHFPGGRGVAVTPLRVSLRGDNAAPEGLKPQLKSRAAPAEAEVDDDHSFDTGTASASTSTDAPGTARVDSRRPSLPRNFVVCDVVSDRPFDLNPRSPNFDARVCDDFLSVDKLSVSANGSTVVVSRAQPLTEDLLALLGAADKRPQGVPSSVLMSGGGSPASANGRDGRTYGTDTQRTSRGAQSAASAMSGGRQQTLRLSASKGHDVIASAGVIINHVFPDHCRESTFAASWNAVHSIVMNARVDMAVRDKPRGLWLRSQEGVLEGPLAQRGMPFPLHFDTVSNGNEASIEHGFGQDNTEKGNRVKGGAAVADSPVENANAFMPSLQPATVSATLDKAARVRALSGRLPLLPLYKRNDVTLGAWMLAAGATLIDDKMHFSVGVQDEAAEEDRHPASLCKEEAAVIGVDTSQAMFDLTARLRTHGHVCSHVCACPLNRRRRNVNGQTEESNIGSAQSVDSGGDMAGSHKGSSIAPSVEGARVMVAKPADSKKAVGGAGIKASLSTSAPGAGPACVAASSREFQHLSGAPIEHSIDPIDTFVVVFTSASEAAMKRRSVIRAQLHAQIYGIHKHADHARGKEGTAQHSDGGVDARALRDGKVSSGNGILAGDTTDTRKDSAESKSEKAAAPERRMDFQYVFVFQEDYEGGPIDRLRHASVDVSELVEHTDFMLLHEPINFREVELDVLSQLVVAVSPRDHSDNIMIVPNGNHHDRDAHSTPADSESVTDTDSESNQAQVSESAATMDDATRRSRASHLLRAVLHSQRCVRRVIFVGDAVWTNVTAVDAVLNKAGFDACSSALAVPSSMGLPADTDDVASLLSDVESVSVNDDHVGLEPPQRLPNSATPNGSESGPSDVQAHLNNNRADLTADSADRIRDSNGSNNGGETESMNSIPGTTASTKRTSKDPCVAKVTSVGSLLLHIDSLVTGTRNDLGTKTVDEREPEPLLEPQSEREEGRHGGGVRWMVFSRGLASTLSSLFVPHPLLSAPSADIRHKLVAWKESERDPFPLV
eukprot:Opistho-2@71665